MTDNNAQKISRKRTSDYRKPMKILSDWRVAFACVLQLWDAGSIFSIIIHMSSQPLEVDNNENWLTLWHLCETLTTNIIPFPTAFSQRLIRSSSFHIFLFIACSVQLSVGRSLTPQQCHDVHTIQVLAINCSYCQNENWHPIDFCSILCSDGKLYFSILCMSSPSAHVNLDTWRRNQMSW